VVTCPCHVPIYLAIFGGTALGGCLRENLSLFLLGLTGIFLLSLSKGLKLIKVNGGDRPG
jgi:mercuric ion transport protein